MDTMLGFAPSQGSEPGYGSRYVDPVRLIVSLPVESAIARAVALPTEQRASALRADLEGQKNQVIAALKRQLHVVPDNSSMSGPNMVLTVPASAFQQKPEPLSLLSISDLPPGVTVRVDGLVRAHR